MDVKDMDTGSLLRNDFKKQNEEKRKVRSRGEKDSKPEYVFQVTCEQWGSLIQKIPRSVRDAFQSQYLWDMGSEYFSICFNPSASVGVLGD